MTDLVTQFSHRFRLLGIIFSVLFSVIVLRALYLGWIAKEKYLDIGKKLSMKKGVLPAKRGNILDKNHLLLVWSEREFSLFARSSTTEKFSDLHHQKLRQTLPLRKISLPPDRENRLCSRLTAEEITALEPLIKSGFPIEIRSTLQRLTVNTPVVKKCSGKLLSGKGISGWEQKHDHILRGKNGSYTVMLDRRRNWIPSSWKVLHPPVHGKNVILSSSLAELEASAGAGK